MEALTLGPATPAADTSPQTVQWRLFIRALAEEIDSLASPSDRDAMLRSMGRRMARMAPLPAVDVLEALEIEMNDALQLLGWGSVQLRLHVTDRALMIQHTGLPRVGSLGSPAGSWLAALLEGLYEVWLGQQPCSQASLAVRRVTPGVGDTVMLRFARG